MDYGLAILRTVGHSPGHQFVLIRREGGWLLLAGQSFRWASEFAMAAYAESIARLGEPDPPSFLDWLPAIMARRVTHAEFAHDRAVWEPAEADAVRG